MLCSLRLALFVLGFILLSSADGLVRRARAAIATAGGEAGGEAARPNPAFGRQPLPPGPFVGSIADDSPHRNFPPPGARPHRRRVSRPSPMALVRARSRSPTSRLHTPYVACHSKHVASACVQP